MRIYYEQRQFSWAMLLAAFAVLTAGLAGIVLADPRVVAAFGWPDAAHAHLNGAAHAHVNLLIVAASITASVLLTPLLFGSLTVRVDSQFLSIRFGIGIVRKQIALTDIESVHLGVLPWYAGRGIRRTRRGWTYTVAGSDVVDVASKDGTHVLVGSGEPRLLKNAIERARAAGEKRG